MSRTTGTPALYATTFRFRSELVDQIEHLRSKIRAKHHRTIPRSVILAGTLEAVLSSKLDLSDCLSAEDVRDAVEAGLKGRSK